MISQRDPLYKELESLNLETQSSNIAESSWLSKLPLIICGPILRKVHYKSVSVWLALKEDVSDIRLDVFVADAPQNILMSGAVKSPIKLGGKLFVTLVTAVCSNSKLASDVIYGYEVSFSYNGKRITLSTETGNNVINGGIKSIVYDSFNFPTFCIPSDKINNLKIVHGSCRKPHGGKTDALRALDTMLEVHQNNVSQRPQLLCLTGDQIYADDVADVLLVKIQQVNKVLFGWEEKLPLDLKTGKDYEDSQLAAGNRKEIIAKHAENVSVNDLSTSDSKSHLIFLQEFISMYLCSFSDTFWFLKWPSWEEVSANYDLSQEEISNKQREYNKNHSRSLSRDEIVQDWLRAKENEYISDSKSLIIFSRSLRFVKRALANVSTLMIFDDHDVTDDWFMTKEWTSVALTQKSLSRRYILNGLLAYTIFQDWGNSYEKYTNGNGLKILEAINLRTDLMKMRNLKDNYLKNIDSNQNKYAEELESILLPKLKSDNESTYLSNRFSWHLRIDYAAFQLILLNTRTERQFYFSEEPLGNLIKNIGSQVGQRSSNKFLILVSATPVFGNIPMEIGQEKLRKGSVFTITGIVSKVMDFEGMYPKDQEAWSFSGKGFSKLVNFLSFSPKVLVLSGDVHYSFTASIRLWRKIGNSYQLSEIVQSTSSALKNSSEETHYPAINRLGLAPKEDGIYGMLKVTGTKSFEISSFSIIKNPRFVDIEDLILNKELLKLGIQIAPSIQFNVKFIKSLGWDAKNPLLKRIERSSQTKEFTDTKVTDIAHRVVVGKDNIGVVSFTNNSLTNTIWYAIGNYGKPDAMESERLLFPFTEQKVVFNNKFNLDELPLNQLSKRVNLKLVKKE